MQLPLRFISLSFLLVIADGGRHSNDKAVRASHLSNFPPSKSVDTSTRTNISAAGLLMSPCPGADTLPQVRKGGGSRSGGSRSGGSRSGGSKSGGGQRPKGGSNGGGCHSMFCGFFGKRITTRSPTEISGSGSRARNPSFTTARTNSASTSSASNSSSGSYPDAGLNPWLIEAIKRNNLSMADFLG